MLKHFLNEYPITPGRIIDEHMCNGPDQFPVLYDRTAAHSLYDPACQL